MCPSTACETYYIYAFDLHRARLNYQIICILFLTRICIGDGGQLKLAPAAQYNIISYDNIHIVGSRLSTIYYYIRHVKRPIGDEGAVTGGVGSGGGADTERGRRALDPRGADETHLYTLYI